MSNEQERNAAEIKALLNEVEERVREKKASGYYDPREIREVEEASVSYQAAQADGVVAEMKLRLSNLENLWDPNPYEVTTHRGGAAGKLIVAFKKLIYKVFKLPGSVILARQTKFNDELVKLLINLTLRTMDNTQRCEKSERRLDMSEDLGRHLTGNISDLRAELKRQETRLGSAEREAGSIRSQTEDLLARLQRLLEEQAASGAVGAGLAQEVNAIRQKSRGAAYLAFEDLHRGDRAEIKKRQSVYLPYFENCRDMPMLDIGCGRGEFVELAGENGLLAKGIDLNPEMAAFCREQGLDVLEADAVGYLRGQEDGSLGGILMSQVIEHLGLDDLNELVGLCAAKLAPGGALIAETINPTCLTTFSGAFYLDMTHQKPIHPEAARFLWRAVGLTEVDLLYLSPYPDDHKLELYPGPEAGASAAFNRNMERLNQLLYSYQDYAVLGRK